MAGLGTALKGLVPSFIFQQKLDVAGAVLFTFDDGPHPEITPRVMDVLERHDARGLFFVPGNRIPRAPQLLREIVARGHGLGNHSATHTDCSKLDYRQIVAEIEQCNAQLLDLAGVVCRHYRPPRGIVTPALLLAARRCGQRIVRWSADSGEYSVMKGATGAAMAERFMAQMHDRAIVLSHDDIDTVPDFLAIALPQLAARGLDMKGGLASLGWRSPSAV